MRADAGFVENDTNAFRLYGVPSTALVLNAGELRGMRDIQLGWWDPAIPSLVGGDISAGSAQHPGVLNIGADVSRTVRLQSRGRTVLRTRRSGVTVHGSLVVCNERCVDLERRVARLSRMVRRLLRG